MGTVRRIPNVPLICSIVPAKEPDLPVVYYGRVPGTRGPFWVRTDHCPVVAVSGFPDTLFTRLETVLRPSDCINLAVEHYKGVETCREILRCGRLRPVLAVVRAPVAFAVAE